MRKVGCPRNETRCAAFEPSNPCAAVRANLSSRLGKPVGKEGELE